MTHTADPPTPRKLVVASTSVPSHAPALTDASDTGPPARRSGRGSGYPQQEEIYASMRDLAKILAKLARAGDVGARQAGADIGVTVTAVLRDAVTLARSSTGVERRAAADLVRLLPEMERRLAAARKQLGLAAHPEMPLTSPPSVQPGPAASDTTSDAAR
jgi:hypothetical protein